jgi:DNA-binding transcriptional LysR family regulator
MIDLSSLQHFLVVARSASLADASDELHLTPSALSKSLKRLEESLQTILFDREGRSLRLSAAGIQLQSRAAKILHDANQLQAEFAGERHAFKCRIVGPHALQLAWGLSLSDRLLQKYPQASLQFEARSDVQSLAAVSSGEHDFALVAVPDGGIHNADLRALVIGKTEYRVAISNLHPLTRKRGREGVPVSEVITHDFVVPVTAAFSNLENRIATDGWRDDVFPRRFRYRTDDLLVTRELVASGKALAYLPDFMVEKLGLHSLSVLDCPYFCRQQIALVYRTSEMKGWVDYLCQSFIDE